MYINTNYNTQSGYNFTQHTNKNSIHFSGNNPNDNILCDNDIVIGTSCVDEFSGKKYFNIIINGKQYKFVEDGISGHKDYIKMIDNIADSQVGFFVKHNRYYEFIPKIYKGTPDIVNQYPLVKHGNAITQDDITTISAANKLSEFLNENIETSELKTIKYIVNTHKHFDNNVLKTAYSYYDGINDKLYLYLYNNGILKTLDSNNYVRTYKI